MRIFLATLLAALLAATGTPRPTGASVVSGEDLRGAREGAAILALLRAADTSRLAPRDGRAHGVPGPLPAEPHRAATALPPPPAWFLDVVDGDVVTRLTPLARTPRAPRAPPSALV